MPTSIGGFIFIPTAHKPSLAQVALHLCERLGAPTQIVSMVERDKRLSRWSSLTPQALAHDLEQDGVGYVYFDIGGLRTRVGFSTPVPGFHELWTTMDDTPFQAYREGYNPDIVRSFARHWGEIGEWVGADYGYFTRYTTMIYEEFRDERILPKLEREDAVGLIQSAQDSFWLTYVGPRLAERWPEPHTLQDGVKLSTFPFGALFIRSPSQAPEGADTP